MLVACLWGAAAASDSMPCAVVRLLASSDSLTLVPARMATGRMKGMDSATARPTGEFRMWLMGVSSLCVCVCRHGERKRMM